MPETWASDVEISMPKVVDSAVPIQVDFGGFGFTTHGICHNFTEADRDEIMSHRFSPQGQVPDGR